MLLLVAGIAGLFVGGNFVVDGASRLGTRFGLTPLVIGLTIVAIGTSAPELAVVLQSVANEEAPLAVGSVVGSNISNVLLVLGLAATFGAVTVTSRVVKLDVPVMIAASVALMVFAWDHQLGRIEGMIFVAALIGFVGWTLRTARTKADTAACDADPIRPLGTLGGSLLRVVAGVGLLALAARFVVDGGSQLARSLGVPELVVGLTIVALGTSAPEIVTTLIAVRRGERDLAVGNAVGSNIFNILLVLGLSSALAVGGIPIGDDALRLDLPIMVATAVACLPLLVWDHRLNRWEGWMFLAYYGAYLLFLGLDSTGHQASELFGLAMTAFVIPLTVVTVGILIYRWRKVETNNGPTATTNEISL